MKNWIFCIVSWFFIFGCAGAPVTEEEIDAAKGEARTINNKYNIACVSLGLPEGSSSYINCVLDFYVREKAEASERRQVLTEALKRQIRK